MEAVAERREPVALGRRRLAAYAGAFILEESDCGTAGTTLAADLVPFTPSATRSSTGLSYTWLANRPTVSADTGAHKQDEPGESNERGQESPVPRSGMSKGDSLVTDEPIVTPRAQNDSTRVKSSRGMLELLGVILVLVVVALLLLMSRGFKTGESQSTVTGGGKQIVPIAGLTADSGIVSAWVSDDVDITAALRIAGLEDSTITDMGGGRYVISVPVGTEETVVRVLGNIDGVHDAGLVYDIKE